MLTRGPAMSSGGLVFVFHLCLLGLHVPLRETAASPTCLLPSTDAPTRAKSRCTTRTDANVDDAYARVPLLFTNAATDVVEVLQVGCLDEDPRERFLRGLVPGSTVRVWVHPGAGVQVRAVPFWAGADRSLDEAWLESLLFVEPNATAGATATSGGASYEWPPPTLSGEDGDPAVTGLHPNRLLLELSPHTTLFRPHASFTIRDCSYDNEDDVASSPLLAPPPPQTSDTLWERTLNAAHAAADALITRVRSAAEEEDALVGHQTWEIAGDVSLPVGRRGDVVASAGDAEVDADRLAGAQAGAHAQSGGAHAQADARMKEVIVFHTMYGPLNMHLFDDPGLPLSATMAMARGLKALVEHGILSGCHFETIDGGLVIISDPGDERASSSRGQEEVGLGNDGGRAQRRGRIPRLNVEQSELLNEQRSVFLDRPVVVQNAVPKLATEGRGGPRSRRHDRRGLVTIIVSTKGVGRSVGLEEATEEEGAESSERTKEWRLAITLSSVPRLDSVVNDGGDIGYVVGEIIPGVASGKGGYSEERSWMTLEAIESVPLVEEYVSATTTTPHVAAHRRTRPAQRLELLSSYAAAGK